MSRDRYLFFFLLPAEDFSNIGEQFLLLSFILVSSRISILKGSWQTSFESEPEIFVS